MVKNILVQFGTCSVEHILLRSSFVSHIAKCLFDGFWGGGDVSIIETFNIDHVLEILYPH